MTRIRYACVVAMVMLLAGAPRMFAATTPYSGTPIPIPGTIPSERFDNGGEGIAFHDTTSGNSGGQFRSTDVDIAASSEGGYTIGWIAAGEWVNYTVSVPSAGNYSATIRVASPNGGGSLHIGFNGPSSVWKTLSIPATGGWQTWTDVVVPVTLGAGTQQMTLLFDTSGYNVSNVRVTAAGGAVSAPTGGPQPYSGSAVVIPGAIQAVNFDTGGEGVAFHDTTSGNAGGAYRTSDVDIAPASDGGYTVGWTAAGEWLNYSVSVGASGSYSVQLRVASPAGATMHVGFNGPSQGTWKQVAIPVTGGWQTWTTVSVPVTLGAGAQIMTVWFDTAGANLETITVAASAATVVSPPPPSSGGGTIAVNAGGDFQAALNRAAPGDTIVLQAGATFIGNFILPATSSSATSYITITTSTPLSSLPGPGTRITPSNAWQLPKIKSPNNEPAIATAAYAHHYRLQYLELPANTNVDGTIIDLGDGSSNQNTLAMVPHDLIVDHVYVHGDPTYGQKRGIGLNSASTTISDSYIASIMWGQADAQAICGWNGPGPFTITNNYIEASGENILFGGADPKIPQLVPSDITISRNWVTKQLAWKGSSFTVKNILELKNAQRVVVNGNVFENNWQAGQAGYAIVFTPRNQEGTAPWSIVQHVEFTNNIVRHVASGINILGTDNLQPSQQTNDIVIRNNVFEDISRAKWGGNGWFLLINGTPNVTVDHNTIFQDGSSALFGDGAASTGFVFTNNILPNNAYAIMGTNASPGNGTIKMFFPSSQFQDNVITAAPASTYPTGNFYPASLSLVGFVDLSTNYRLSSSSSYLNAGTDGKDIGANIDAINAAAGTSY